jgi:hypothetical protein
MDLSKRRYVATPLNWHMSMHERNALPSCPVRDRIGPFYLPAWRSLDRRHHCRTEWVDNFAALSIEKRGKVSDPEVFSADVDSLVRPIACFSIAPMRHRRWNVIPPPESPAARHHGTFLLLAITGCWANRSYCFRYAPYVISAT